MGMTVKNQLCGGLVGLILGVSVILPNINTYMTTKRWLDKGLTRSKIEYHYKELSKGDLICKYIVTLGVPGKNLAYKLYEK